MITISIGGNDRPMEEVDAAWVNEQLGRRQRDGDRVCLRIAIHEEGAHVLLATVNCASGEGSGRMPNKRERRILDLWTQLGLNEPSFSGGQIIAFLKQLVQLL